MYLKLEDGIFDEELTFLADMLSVLDSRLDVIDRAVELSSDPDSMGLFDQLEFVAGMGFVACQWYMSSTFGPLGVSKRAALQLGPCHAGGETIACVVNATANFWKHQGEWDLGSRAFREHSGLTPVQLRTIEVMESVTPWDVYTCFNVLAALTLPGEPRLKNLLPQLEAWRDALDRARGG